MAKTGIILIGGAPLTGKTTVTRRLGLQFGCACVSTDDIGVALQTMTTPQTHPDLHPHAGEGSREYYLEHSVEHLVEKMQRKHRAMWPAVAAIVREHVIKNEPIIIEGYALRPEWVAQLNLPTVSSVWLTADEPTLRQRIFNNKQFLEYLRGPAGGDEAVERFIARSVRCNQMIMEQADSLGLPLVAVNENTSLEETCEITLKHVLRA